MSLSLPREAPAPAPRPRLRLLEHPQEGSRVELTSVVFALALCSAVALGALVRVAFVSSSDFPLNDGGLFYAMTEDLRGSGFSLPALTTYNAADIPFAYPPLGFYAAAALAALTPLDTFDALRVLPLVVNTLTIAAFILLARRLLSSQTAVLAAAFAFALLPRSFLWLIMGGGLTRSFGFLFALLALHQLHRVYIERARSAFVLAALFAGAALLSHTEMAWFLAFSATWMLTTCARNRRAVVDTALIGVGALVVSAPWWLAVLAQHGPGPFLAAGQTGSLLSADAAVSFVVFDATSERLFPVMLLLGAIGGIACLANRRWFLPGWLLLTALFDPRSFATVASVPLALLIGLAVSDVLLPFLTQRRRLPVSLPDEAVAEGPRVAQSSGHAWVTPVVLGALVLYATLSALVSTSGTLVALSEEERDAMTWVSANTPASSRFVVVSGEPWEQDRASEWFPVLAERQSAATPRALSGCPGSASGRKPTSSYRPVVGTVWTAWTAGQPPQERRSATSTCPRACLCR
jgi:hypothetical protein